MFILLLQSANEADKTVDSKKDTDDEDHHVKTVTESKHNAKYYGNDREDELKRILQSCLEYFDKRNGTLNCKKDTENKENDLCCKPSEKDDSKTDSKAYRTACPVLLEEVKSTGNDEEYSRNRHSPFKRFGTEDCEKHTDNDVQYRREELGILFLCHNCDSFRFFSL